MKLDILAASLLALPLIALCAAGDGGNRAIGTDDLAAITTVLDDFHDAASKADGQRYFSHWTAESVFLGTDATERWVGDQFRAFAEPHFSNGKGWTYHPRNRTVSVDAAQGFAWFDELLDNDSYGECRGSGVLARRDNRWVILQYNLSIPIPNDMAAAETARITEWKRQNAPQPAPTPAPK
jgi:hypothetical protein